jgi:hypothetical protein
MQDEGYWLKAAVLIRKRQEIFMAEILAFHTGEAVVQIATIEIAIDYLLDIGPPGAILPGGMHFFFLPSTLSVLQKQHQPGETSHFLLCYSEYLSGNCDGSISLMVGIVQGYFI